MPLPFQLNLVVEQNVRKRSDFPIVGGRLSAAAFKLDSGKELQRQQMRQREISCFCVTFPPVISSTCLIHNAPDVIRQQIYDGDENLDGANAGNICGRTFIRTKCN